MIIGRPSQAEELIIQAAQRAEDVERAAAADIEQFAAQQVAAESATEVTPFLANAGALAGAEQVLGGAGSLGGSRNCHSRCHKPGNRRRRGFGHPKHSDGKRRRRCRSANQSPTRSGITAAYPWEPTALRQPARQQVVQPMVANMAAADSDDAPQAEQQAQPRPRCGRHRRRMGPEPRAAAAATSHAPQQRQRKLRAGEDAATQAATGAFVQRAAARSLARTGSRLNLVGRTTSDARR